MRMRCAEPGSQVDALRRGSEWKRKRRRFGITVRPHIMLYPSAEATDALPQESNDERATCERDAVQAAAIALEAQHELVFPAHKRITANYSSNAEGARELHLQYGEKEIVFDEPELFAFGEGLARHSRFVASSATTWGEGYDWPRVSELLRQLLDEGILQRADLAVCERTGQGSIASPLPPALTHLPRTWLDCEAISRELTGRALEIGYLELVVPIYRIAHLALDTEGRQVGEANVFPMQLRLDVATEWRTCHSAGSRYRDDLPMNITALKSMVKYWKETLSVLVRVREAYLQRFPQARSGWTVGDMQRLSALVLTLPTYLLMRAVNRVENGQLHPVFSSLFRVTDGVRMTMHRMLFTSANEPARAPQARISAAEIYSYAERNTVFLSDHGVCAGPKAMIEEFLRVLVDGEPVDDAGAMTLSGSVSAGLDDLDGAFDYGLLGLQAYAVAFSLWPKMCRTYERLLALLQAYPYEGSDVLASLRERLSRTVQFLQTSTRLKSEADRHAHECVYSDMYRHCALALGAAPSDSVLAKCIARANDTRRAQNSATLRSLLLRRLALGGAAASLADALTEALMDYFAQELAIVRAAVAIQRRIGQMLGRCAPIRALTAADLALHYRLVASEYAPGELNAVGGRLPYLPDDLEAELGLRVIVSREGVTIVSSW
jgi:hypothetical protein